MDTIIQANLLNVTDRTAKAANVEISSTSDFWQQAESNRFGIIPMLLVIITCLGGVAAAVAVQESTFQLAVVASAAMVVEAVILAVMPMRTIAISSVISVVISLLVIAF